MIIRISRGLTPTSKGLKRIEFPLFFGLFSWQPRVALVRIRRTVLLPSKRDWQERIVLILIGIIVISTFGYFVFKKSQPVQASPGTVYADPNGDITTETLSDCVDYYDCVNDAVRQPTAPTEYNYNGGEMDGYYNSFTTTNPDLGGGTATQIKIWAYCSQQMAGVGQCSGTQTDDCTLLGEAECPNYYQVGYAQCGWVPNCTPVYQCYPPGLGGWEIDLSFNDGSTWLSDIKGLSCPIDSYGWTSVTYSGSWSQSEVNGLAIKTILDTDGSHYAYMEEVYAEVTYTLPNFDQKHFKIYQDDAGLNLATQYANEDTNYNVNVNTNFRIRFEVANTGDGSGNITRRLEFKEDSGSWTQITTGTNNVRLSLSDNFADGDATTTRLTATGTFTAGQGKESGSDTTQISLTNAYYTEDEYCLKFQSAAAGKTYQFRITNAGTALNTYTNTPSITPPSVLSITVPATAEFPDFTIGTSPSKSTISDMGDVDADGDSSAWDVTVYIGGNFICTTDGAKVITISASNVLRMDPKTIQVVTSGDNDANVVAQAAFDIIATGSGNQYTVIDGGNPGGTGVYGVNPELKLDIPLSVKLCDGGSYQATLTFTIA